jgi:hypothetical protein
MILSSIVDLAPHESVFFEPSGKYISSVSLPDDRKITCIVGDYPFSLFPVESLFFAYAERDVVDWQARVAPGGFLAMPVPCESLPNVEKLGPFWVYRKPEYHLPGESYRISYKGYCDFGSLSGSGDAVVSDLNTAGWLSERGWRIYCVAEKGKYFDLLETFRRMGLRGGVYRFGDRIADESMDLVVVPAFALSWYWVLRPGGVLLVGSASAEMFDCFPGAMRVGSWWAIRRPLLFTGASCTISF